MALAVYAAGLRIPAFLPASWLLVLVPAVAAGAVRAQPGVGSLLGPLTVGLTVE